MLPGGKIPGLELAALKIRLLRPDHFPLVPSPSPTSPLPTLDPEVCHFNHFLGPALAERRSTAPSSVPGKYAMTTVPVPLPRGHREATVTSQGHWGARPPKRVLSLQKKKRERILGTTQRQHFAKGNLHLPSQSRLPSRGPNPSERLTVLQLPSRHSPVPITMRPGQQLFLSCPFPQPTATSSASSASRLRPDASSLHLLPLVLISRPFSSVAEVSLKHEAATSGQPSSECFC